MSTHNKFYISFILSLFLITLAIYSSFSQQNTTIGSIYVWIKQNPNASKKQLQNIIDTQFLSLQKTPIIDIYNLLKTILQSYPRNIIPLSVYTHYASLSELQLDFETAARMYYLAYLNTNNPSYLIKSAINEFERGRQTTASTYLDSLQYEPSTANKIKIAIIKANILANNGDFEPAIAILQKIRNTIPPNETNAELYYTLYQIAKDGLDINTANEALQILNTNSPSSIEVYMIHSTHVSQLPLPSQILSIGRKIRSAIDNVANIAPIDTFKKDTTPPNKTNITIPSTSIDQISDPPDIGFQVASFRSFINAQNAMQYYYKIWETSLITEIDKPRIVEKYLFTAIFYQIIFPFPTNTDSYSRDILIKKLRNAKLEGFIVRRK